MYVAKVKLEDVRGFHDARKVDLDLSRPDGDHAGWTVVTGPTGSGRSTFLRAIALAIAGPAEAPALAGEPETWVAQGKSRGGIEVDLVAGPDDQFARGFTPADGDKVLADLVLTPDGITAESNVGRNGPWQGQRDGLVLRGLRALPSAHDAPRTQGQVSPGSSNRNWPCSLRPYRLPCARRHSRSSTTGWCPASSPPGGKARSCGSGRPPIRALGDGDKSLIALVLDLLRLLGGEAQTRTGGSS
jgi:energy-coupling factor transporter ATP-binding protein EcfA2